MPKKLEAIAPAHAEVAGRQVHLGKLEVKKDKRNLKLAKYLPRDLSKLERKPKGTITRSTMVPSGFGMYGNDTLPDCTCAAVGNLDRLYSAVAGRPEIPSDGDVLSIFDATGPRDDGRYCLDILNYWRRVGFGAGEFREKIVGFVQIDPGNFQHMKIAIDFFGGAYIGLALPISAQRQSVWKVTSGSDSKPGSWGGHCVAYVDYRPGGFGAASWGEVVRLTKGFHGKYCDEAYAIISPDWVSQEQDSPSGFKLDQLLDDFDKIGS